MEIRVEIRDESPEEAVGKRSRRRGAELEQAILAAAVTELSGGGYEHFTMDAVAARAGTNKNAIYRRWPGRTALATAAYKSMVERPEEVPDTGELRQDVLTLLRSVVARIGSPTAMVILRPLLADARSKPELMADLRDRLSAHPDLMLGIVARAVARGQARPEALQPRIYRLPVTLLQAEYLTAGPDSVDDAVLTEIVDLVFLPLVRPPTPGRGAAG